MEEGHDDDVCAPERQQILGELKTKSVAGGDESGSWDKNPCVALNGCWGS